MSTDPTHRNADPTKPDAFDVCPECGCGWGYRLDGKRYTNVIGIYSREQDRTVAWRCPDCAHEWPRNGLDWSNRDD